LQKNTDQPVEVKIVLHHINGDLLEIQKVFEKALITENVEVKNFDDNKVLETSGFVSAHWDGTAATEEKMTNETTTLDAYP
jgi:prolyl-tRNA synthetase